LFLLEDVTIPPMHEVDVVGRVKGVMNGTFEITSHSEDHQRSRRGSRGCWRVSNAVASVKNGLVTVRIANFSKMPISLANKRHIASTMPITKVLNVNIHNDEHADAEIVDEALAQVRCELDKAVVHLSANERMLVQEMLRKHENVWSRELGHINVDPFEIHTTPGPCGAHVARGREPLERTVKTASPEG
jgi:hypothetical protein